MRDTRRRLLELANQLEPSLARAFITAVNQITSQAQLLLIATAIEEGRIDDVVRILQIRPETFDLLDAQIRQVFIAGAAYQIDSVPGKALDPETGARLIVRFGGSQPRAQQIVAQSGARLVTNITETVRETVRQTVSDALSESRPPRAVALDLVGRTGASGRRSGGVIGLSAPQAKIVQDIRRALAEGDTDRLREYLRFERRDRRFDAAVRRRIAGEAMTQTQINRITGRLADRYLQLRGETIARTETIPALNQGRREAVQQMIDRGVIQAFQVKRKWDSSSDARTRPMHLQMEGQEVEWGEPFVAPNGDRLMHPGDTELGAGGDNTVGCRCYMAMPIDFLLGAT